MDTAKTLNEIASDPYANLGQRSLSALSAFLMGYSYACAEMGGDEPLLPGSRSFYDLIFSKLGLPRSQHHWESLIAFVAEVDSRAFDLFYVLWRDYVNQPRVAVVVQAPPPKSRVEASGLRDLVGALRVSWDVSAEPSITRLFFFVNGYTRAFQDRAKTLVGSIDFAAFSEWLSEKYLLGKVYSWHKVILFYHPGEINAFHRFFRLLDEFLAGRKN